MWGKMFFFFFSSRRRHTSYIGDWSSDVCSSDLMEGAKALALDAFAERRGLAMLRFDYSGTGSSGGRFEEGTLALWLEEALAVVDQLTQGPLVLVEVGRASCRESVVVGVGVLGSK